MGHWESTLVRPPSRQGLTTARSLSSSRRPYRAHQQQKPQPPCGRALCSQQMGPSQEFSLLILLQVEFKSHHGLKPHEHQRNKLYWDVFSIFQTNADRGAKHPGTLDLTLTCFLPGRGSALTIFTITPLTNCGPTAGTFGEQHSSFAADWVEKGQE